MVSGVRTLSVERQVAIYGAGQQLHKTGVVLLKAK